jgi:phosphoglycerate dehydrogenase-like enzyme
MTPGHKLLILSGQAAEYERLLAAAALPGLDLVAARTPEEARPLGPDCDLLFGEPVLLRHVLNDLPRLAWAQATWAGVEQLLDPSLRRDYLLTNARGVFGGLMSEYVFSYLLSRERRILSRFASQQAGRWDRTEPGSLRGKLFGLLGLGSIGCHLAGTAKHFGMRVRGYTRESESCPDVEQYFHGAELAAFTAGLDYLVCSLPGTAATHHFVDAQLLAGLPERALFVSVGRGSAVDESALDAALRAGRLGGAVLDVFEQEPLPASHPFWTAPNLVITAHTAALTNPSDLAGVFIENYRLLVEGKPLKYRVDFERGY